MQVVPEAAVQARSSHSVTHFHSACGSSVSSRRALYIGRCDSHADLDIPEEVTKSPLQVQQTRVLRCFWVLTQLSDLAATAGLQRPVAPATLACSTATGERGFWPSMFACSFPLTFCIKAPCSIPKAVIAWHAMSGTQRQDSCNAIV